MDELDTESSVSLGEVVHRDQELYEEVCQSFVDLYRVSVKLLDSRGNRLMDIPSRADLCQYIYEFAPCRRACIQIVGAIRTREPSFQSIESAACFSGAEYRIVPIHHATDVVGKVVFGPFLPKNLNGCPPAFLSMDPNLNRDDAWERTARFRRMSPVLAEKVAKNLATVIEVMSFVGFKGQMTTDMHVESITEAYAELESKNNALQASVEQLRHLNHQRSTFLARIGDQLKMPLTNLTGYAEMLIEGIGGDVTEDQEEFLNTIIDQAELITGLTRTMDELSRIERQEIELVPEQVSVAELLDAALVFGRKLGTPGDVEVELFPPDDYPKLWVDEQKIRSAVFRVVENAVKFTPAGGRVVLAAIDAEDRVKQAVPPGFLGISVSDNGIGLDAAGQARIFEPFFSVHDADVGYSGTGVGLSIAKAYVEAHGGNIQIDSTPGTGSTFTIVLPLRPLIARR